MSDSLVNIGGRDIVSLILSEAKRRPAIAELVARAHEMTDDEIATVKVPLPWYRKALKKLRDQKENAEFELYVLENSTEIITPDGGGAIYRYTGMTDFIAVDRDGQIEVKTGMLIWFPKSGGVWIDTLFSETIDPKLGQSIHVSNSTKTEYTHARYEHRQQNAPTEAQSGGFRIIR